jgi:hypothetical protein
MVAFLTLTYVVLRRQGHADGASLGMEHERLFCFIAA